LRIIVGYDDIHYGKADNKVTTQAKDVKAGISLSNYCASITIGRNKWATRHIKKPKTGWKSGFNPNKSSAT
jgi:hypothetical protein